MQTTKIACPFLIFDSPTRQTFTILFDFSFDLFSFYYIVILMPLEGKAKTKRSQIVTIKGKSIRNYHIFPDQNKLLGFILICCYFCFVLIFFYFCALFSVFISNMSWELFNITCKL